MVSQLIAAQNWATKAINCAKHPASQAITVPSVCENGATTAASKPKTIAGPANGTASMLAGIELKDIGEPSATKIGNTANWAAIVTVKIWIIQSGTRLGIVRSKKVWIRFTQRISPAVAATESAKP